MTFIKSIGFVPDIDNKPTGEKIELSINENFVAGKIGKKLFFREKEKNSLVNYLYINGKTYIEIEEVEKKKASIRIRN